MERMELVSLTSTQNPKRNVEENLELGGMRE